ncbi:uncharacterized protein F5Z01DRAFT_492102 [Emericellopsis atlantica]|uniref:Nuclear membrane fusion protein Kar5 n=1 Tax=Emericellopsis atlantica TaxID=2614577 RepID=A0A9P8CS12_9HYPO|nr:uncharacterized protein F5Z01DRAFT_492102 [Emericellopsis atlantica]KAG9256902.1 hypothetical protein F5Z01DRAFT_492102 [Emericellopsis atlantica]
MLLHVFISLLGAGAQIAHCLSWGYARQQDYERNSGGVSLEDQSRLSNAYSLALSELRELESEPLCHRNAARLLVNHCQLLEGKDEATVHTDSGRLTRDFVDSYATSLAICDLERGSFRIPSECAAFRETTLASLPIPSTPQLHVPTTQIDKCLEGLAQSDSAWNTWISYRHKALRFCDAARADNKKDEHIRLYQRVSKVLERLTTEVESHMESRLASLNNALERAGSLVDGLDPRVDAIRRGLLQLEDILDQKVLAAAGVSQQAIMRSADEAQNLHELLVAIMFGAHRQQEEMEASHETAISRVTMHANAEAEVIAANLATAASSSVLIHNELVNSQARVEEVARRQKQIEQGMHNLEAHAEHISFRYHEHVDRLSQAQRRADDILDTLDTVASSASKLNMFMPDFGIRGWWPYIYCPAFTIVAGSWGLPASLARNIALIGLGEAFGFVVSITAEYIAADNWKSSTSVMDNSLSTNHSSIHAREWAREHSSDGGSRGNFLSRAF